MMTARCRYLSDWARRALILAGLAGAPLLHLQADEPPVQLDGAVVELEGDATLHGWSCESGGAYVRITPGMDLEPVYRYLRDCLLNPPADLDKVVARIQAYQQQVRVEVFTPVDSLDCGSRGLERDLSRAVKADEHPLINFAFARVKDGTIETHTGRAVLTLHTEGELTLAGQTRMLNMDVTITLADNGTLRFGMGRDILMTDYGVQPPTALFGLIRARDLFSFHLAYELTESTVLLHDARGAHLTRR